MQVATIKPAGLNRFYIPGLDGIRAIAVLLVFVFHAQILPHVPGELATTTFFFLSGFLITTLFLREWKKTGDVKLGSFYWRRTLRILPPLYLVLAAAYAAHKFLNIGGGLSTFWVMGNFFHYTNYAMAMTGIKDGFLPGMILLWSLAVDEHYYIIFAPLFKLGIKKSSVQVMMLGILTLCVAAPLWRMHLVHADGIVTFRETMASDARMDSILWGALLALWRNAALDASRAAVLAKPLPVVLGVIGLLLPTFSMNETFRATWGYTIQGLAFMPLFTLAMLKSSRGPLKVLNSRPLLWISQISYPLYLTQWLMLDLCYKFVPGPHVVQALVAIPLAIGLASLIHIYIERPVAKLRKSRKKAATPVLLPEPVAVAS